MAKMTRRALVLGAMGATLAAPAIARAQGALPNIIKIVVPFPPGGTVDADRAHGAARSAAEARRHDHHRKQAGRLGQPRCGPGGKIAAGRQALGVRVFDTHAVNPFLQNLPFDTEKDLEPVLLIGIAPNVLATHPGKPFKSFADIVAAAKAKPDTVTYGSIGSGSLGHLTMVLLSERARARAHGARALSRGRPADERCARGARRSRHRQRRTGDPAGAPARASGASRRPEPRAFPVCRMSPPPSRMASPASNPTPGGARLPPGARLAPSSTASARRSPRRSANPPSRAGSRACRSPCASAARTSSASSWRSR